MRARRRECPDTVSEPPDAEEAECDRQRSRKRRQNRKPGRSRIGQGSASTGVGGLDYLLRGGLPAHRIHLVEGHPGCGKDDPRPAVPSRGREARRVVHVHHPVGDGRRAARQRGVARLGSLRHPHSGSSAGREPACPKSSTRCSIHRKSNWVTCRGTCSKRLRHSSRRARCSTRCPTCGCWRRDSLRYRRQILGLKQFFVGPWLHAAAAQRNRRQRHRRAYPEPRARCHPPRAVGPRFRHRAPAARNRQAARCGLRRRIPRLPDSDRRHARLSAAREPAPEPAAADRDAQERPAADRHAARQRRADGHVHAHPRAVGRGQIHTRRAIPLVRGRQAASIARRFSSTSSAQTFLDRGDVLGMNLSKYAEERPAESRQNRARVDVTRRVQPLGPQGGGRRQGAGRADRQPHRLSHRDPGSARRRSCACTS